MTLARPRQTTKSLLTACLLTVALSACSTMTPQEKLTDICGDLAQSLAYGDHGHASLVSPRNYEEVQAFHDAHCASDDEKSPVNFAAAY